jgi:ABC-type cobalamin/Fe3+-siderophores transport system ATPase subunit
MNLLLQNVTAGYGKKVVVDNVTFELTTGEVICLLGANGSGKTTLFKTVLRLLRPQSGSIRLGGENIAHWPQQRLARTFGYVPQMHTPPFAFLVRDVVLMARAAHLPTFASPGLKDERIADESLERLGIRQLAKARYTEISGGERQLVLIARTLAQQPQWLILDEPTANLDFGNQIRVLHAVAELASEGLGILMTTHMPDHAFLCAARVVLMSQGRVIAVDCPKVALTEEALIKAYGVPLHIVEIPSQPGTCMVVPTIL